MSPGAEGRSFDAILFDLSGVVITSAFAPFVSVLGDQLPYDEALELMMGSYHEDTDHPWHRVERGEIEMAEWFAHVDGEVKARGLTADWGALRTAFEQLAVHDVIVDRIRTLRAEGYRVALVTNNVREGSESWRALLDDDVDELFDAVVDSSSVGMRKPDPRIYLHALELLGSIDPGRAVFLDDHPGNIEGARRAGLVGILVDDPAEAVAELDGILTAR
jgi:epoxide hydrolase-like predicted phosphatase